MSEADTFRYDVAFSFLSGDLALAETLADGLAPALSCFVYSRKKEEILGGDGMDQFAEVFGGQARLAVVLHRKGWGETAWTAVEESQIKSRGLVTRMTSFLVVRLDDADLPVWVPDTHLYASTSTESNSDILAVIRVRARQKGATLRTESPQELALRLTRAQAARKCREDHQRSPAGAREVRAEVAALFTEIVRLADAIRATVPEIDLDAGTNGEECAVASSRGSISLAWQQGDDSTLDDACLRVNHWNARVRIPRRPSEGAAGLGWHHAEHYMPELSDGDVWVWRYASQLDDYGGDDGGLVVLGGSPGEARRTADLADYLVRSHLEGSVGS